MNYSIKLKNSKNFWFGFILLLLLVNYFSFSTVNISNSSAEPFDPLFDSFFSSVHSVHSSTTLQHHFIFQRQYVQYSFISKNKLFNPFSIFYRFFKSFRLPIFLVILSTSVFQKLLNISLLCELNFSIFLQSTYLNLVSICLGIFMFFQKIKNKRFCLISCIHNSFKKFLCNISEENVNLQSEYELFNYLFIFQ